MSKQAEVFQALLNMSETSFIALMNLYESGSIENPATIEAIEALLAFAGE